MAGLHVFKVQCTDTGKRSLTVVRYCTKFCYLDTYSIIFTLVKMADLLSHLLLKALLIKGLFHKKA